MNAPLLQLNNGVEMPALRFGVFQTSPDETVAAVETTVWITDCGYAETLHAFDKGLAPRAGCLNALAVTTPG